MWYWIVHLYYNVFATKLGVYVQCHSSSQFTRTAHLYARMQTFLIWPNRKVHSFIQCITLRFNRHLGRSSCQISEWLTNSTLLSFSEMYIREDVWCDIDRPASGLLQQRITVWNASSILISHCAVVKPFWNFVQSTAVSLPCSVQIVKAIRRLKFVLCTEEISRGLGLRCVSGE